MFTKGLATVALAATLLTSNAGMALAQSGGQHGSDDSKGSPRMEARMEKRHELKLQNLALVDGACMSTAIEVRDSAEIAQLDTRNAAIKTALTARKDALKAAWALTDVTAKSAALKKAGEEYRAATKAVEKTLRTAKRASSIAFNTSRKLCGPGGGDGVQGSISDDS